MSYASTQSPNLNFANIKFSPFFAISPNLILAKFSSYTVGTVKTSMVSTYLYIIMLYMCHQLTHPFPEWLPVDYQPQNLWAVIKTYITPFPIHCLSTCIHTLFQTHFEPLHNSKIVGHATVWKYPVLEESFYLGVVASSPMILNGSHQSPWIPQVLSK